MRDGRRARRRRFPPAGTDARGSAFAEVYGLGARPRAERKVIDLDSAAIAPLAGRYVAVQGAVTLTFDLSARGSALSMYSQRVKRSWRLWPEAADTFFDANNGNTLVVERDSTGFVRALRLGRPADAPRALKVP